jgi:KDO2-lipid IV(A) lauroyltransferase
MHTEAQLRRIARASFEHFAQLYLVELSLTPRLISPWSWARHVELGNLGPVLRELLAERGTIMLTPHFGNYELLGYTVCRLGVPITAVMRPLDNPLINEYLVRSRQSGGLTLLFKRGATAQAPEVLARGGALCFIADQDAGRKGLFVEFFGRPASTYKSIGLLALTHRVPVVVGCAVRIRAGFHYRIDVQRIIQPEEWMGAADPLRWVTQEFSRAMETAIRAHPEQYLWLHRRWKHQPNPPPRRAATTAAP